MSDPPAFRRSPAREIGRFLEIQNLGLNLPFAVAFLFLAAHGLPAPLTTLDIVVAFVAARNAGHSFNRYVDRRDDAANPRTRDRAIPAGRLSPRFALAFAAANAAVFVVAAYLLNPLAFALSFVALVLLFGYSYTKRLTPGTTAFLGLVEAITPPAVYIGVTGALPVVALVAGGALLLWGTAFETIHSLGDLDSDRALGLRSLPRSLGVERSVRLVAVLHAAALATFAAFGIFVGLRAPYFAALGAMAIVALVTDRALARAPTEARVPFERHFLLSALYLAGVVAALFVIR